MSGWMSYFGGRKDPKVTSREAIVTLRQQLQLLEKKEEYLLKKIEEELKKAQANVISNKPAATAALRRKKALETELERLSGTYITLETQVNAIESANFNATTMEAMKKGADALKDIHGKLKIADVDEIMDSIREQIELTTDISDAISNPMNIGVEINDEDLNKELAELEAEKLGEALTGAEPVPSHIPSAPELAVESWTKAEREAEEQRQLRELEAQLAL